MRTTYFWKATHEPEPGVRYVSISRQNLRGAENMEKYFALMPDWKLINLAHEMGYSKECFETYRKEYFGQLKNLDAEKVYQELKGCVLVCFESRKDRVGCCRIYPRRGKRQTDSYKKIRRKFYFFVKIRHIKYIKQKNIIPERRPALYGKKHYQVFRCDKANHN